MGQFCSGGSGPDLDVNTDKIAEMIGASLAVAEIKSKENKEIFTAGIAEAGDDPYKVPDSEVELTKESTEADIGKAAVAAAFAFFASVKMDDLKANIWKEVEAHLDKQIEAMEEEKRPAAEEIEGSKKDIKERDVDKEVDDSFAAKKAELEKFYDPEPEPEPEKPAEEDKKEDEKAEEPKEEAAADDAAKEADKAVEEEPAADEAAPEEPAKEEAAAEEPAAEEAADEKPAAEEAAGDAE